MEKLKSQKTKQWRKNDYISIALLIVFNVILIAGMFIVTIFINGRAGGITLKDYFKSNLIDYINFIVLECLLVTVMIVYLAYEDSDFLKSVANTEMIFLVMEISLVICYLCEKYISPYIRPIPVVVILLLFLCGNRKALFFNFEFCLLYFLCDSFIKTDNNFSDYTSIFFLIASLVSGTMAICILKNVYSRAKVLLLSFILSIPIVLCVVLPVVGLSDDKVIKTIICAILSGPLSAIIFMVLLPIFEIIFKKITSFKLAELTDHNSKFIKKMINEAPGTFNHSIIVSNIAEACAIAVGEDALLARTCAYYHDLGKLRRPNFFKENQTDNNPHEDLTPELSANIIKAHAQDGYSLAIKNRLPKEIADVCREHHGTLPILYFYGKAKKFTDGEVDISAYCYPGPKPQTKIAAIIMIADGCEAAARTLTDRSRDNVKEIVKSIVSDRMKWGQFDECEITLKELSIIIHTVVNSLSGVYHTRIDYPKVSLDGIDVEKVKENIEAQAKEQTDTLSDNIEDNK